MKLLYIRLDFTLVPQQSVMPIANGTDTPVDWGVETYTMLALYNHLEIMLPNTGGVLFFGKDTTESHDAIRQAEQSIAAIETILGEEIVKLRNR